MPQARCCVAKDTLVNLASGHRVPIAELAGKSVRVVSLTHGILGETTALITASGPKSLFTLSLATGRLLRAPSEHELLGPGGAISLARLMPGARLPIARRAEAPASGKRWRDDELILLGQLVGDGSYLRNAPLRYATASEENDEAVAKAARALGSTVKRYAGRGKWHQLLISGNGNRWHPAGVGKWLKDVGIFGQRSHEKRLPAEVFELSDDQVALLLRHLWATDGCISVRKSGTRGGQRIFFATSSRGLALDVAALLLRFAIVARIRATTKEHYRPCYSVDVSGAHQKIFLERIGAFGPRVTPAERLRASLEGRKNNTNVDTLPIQATAAVMRSMNERAVSFKRLAELRGVATQAVRRMYSFSLSRQLMDEIATFLGDASLRQWSTSDLFWDRVISITPAGEDETCEVRVPNGTAWLADGIANFATVH